MASSATAAISLAGGERRRVRPGSPWMPMPSSISAVGEVEGRLARRPGRCTSVSATPNDRERSLTSRGHRGDRGQVGALLGERAGDLLHEHGRAGAAPPRRVEASPAPPRRR